MKRRIRNKIDGKLIATKNKLYSSSDIRKSISKIKNDTAGKNLQKYFIETIKNPLAKNFLFKSAFPTKLEDIKNRELLYYSGSGNELLWIALMIKNFSSEVNNFIKLQEELSKNILFGNKDICRSILEDVVKNYGYSIWYIENQIAVLEEMYGLEHQKKYLKELSKNDKIDSVVRYFAYYFSLRAEKNISVEKFNEVIKQQIEELRKNGFNEMYIEYFVIKLNYWESFPVINPIGTIILEQDAPIIDIYCTFLKICQLILADNKLKSNYSNFVESAIKIINDEINDDRVINLSNYFGLKTKYRKINIERSNKLLEFFDNYTLGKYVDAIDQGKELTNRFPQFLEIIETILKSQIRSNKEFLELNNYSILSSIKKSFVDILLNTKDSTSAFMNLLRLSNIFHHFSWSSQIMAFLANEYLNEEIDEFRLFKNLGYLHGCPNNPKFTQVIEDKTSKLLYLNSLDESNSNHSSVAIRISMINESYDLFYNSELSKIPSYRLKKYSAIILQKQKRYKNALEMYNSSDLLNDVLYKTDSLIGLIECYLHSDLIVRALNLIIDAYLSKIEIYRRIPIEKILTKMERHLEAIKGELSVPILYDMYSKFISNKRNLKRFEAYEDYLESIYIQRPTELSPFINSENRDKCVYFLKNICVPEVMDNSIVFRSSEDVELERISVCQLLSNIDPENTIEYLEEIKSITQRLMISKGIREIEKSKIYVDVQGIKKLLEKSIKESYARYQAYLDADIDDSNDKIILTLGKLLEERSYELIILDGSEKYNLFKNMITDIRDKFVSSNEFGLDTYLSTGIRHGTLSGQLRSKLESAKLVTLKDLNTNIYRENEFWMNEYHYFSENINTILSEFSNNIDTLIDQIKNEYIQIKTENKNREGLFNFIISEKDIKTLQINVTKDTTYEEFINDVIVYLWNITDLSLKSIRTIFQNDLKVRFNNIFDNLQSSLAKLSPNLKDINSNISRARTDIQYEIDKLASWFTRSSETGISDYEIGLPIDIAFEMVKNIYPLRSILLTKHLQVNSKFKGNSLRSFVTIFFILFDNIIKHDGFDGNESTSDLIVQIESNTLNINITNKISDATDFVTEQKKLSNLTEVLNSNASIEIVKKEGGTGFYKILRTIKVDLETNGGLTFDYNTTEFKFFVQIKIQLKETII